MNTPTPKLHSVLAGESVARPPIWFTRQAGRSLPEYRALRETTPDFIAFCLDPVKATEATLQPMRRFAFDAAIVFADILLIPRALGQLADATGRYLAMQVRAGAQVLKIFESWAEQLPEDRFEALVTRPHQQIVAYLRAEGITAPVIGFPRGAGALVETYAEQAGVQGLGLDVQAPAALGRRLQERVAIQGALDPLLLRAGGLALEQRVETFLEQWGGGPYIFNLGHRVLPDTPVEHIAAVVKRVTCG